MQRARSLCSRAPRLSRCASTLTPEDPAAASSSAAAAAAAEVPPRVIFSGIQPTGIPHIGNYLGALQAWVHMQRAARAQDTLLFAVVGWHALTLPQDPRALRAARRDMFAALVAVGLDPARCVIFHQDENPDHAELAWLLNCVTPVGRLRRMTTWKSRLAVSRNANAESEVDEALLNTGLFTYPVLQAADILAYRSTHVPVGADQQQHLELCRDLAALFNRTVRASLFPLPEAVFTPSRRVLSLTDPTAKMSKSAPDAGSRILLTDTAAAIRAKLRRAVTDAEQTIEYDPARRPGTANLLALLAGCTDGDACALAARYRDTGHAALKDAVADAVEETLRGPRAEFLRLRAEPAHLDALARRGAERAREMSRGTLARVRRLVGLS